MCAVLFLPLFENTFHWVISLAIPQYNFGLAFTVTVFDGLCPGNRIYGVPIVGWPSDPLLLQRLSLR